MWAHLPIPEGSTQTLQRHHQLLKPEAAEVRLRRMQRAPLVQRPMRRRATGQKKTMTSWMKSWMMKSWMRSSRRPPLQLLSLPLLQELQALQERRWGVERTALKLRLGLGLGQRPVPDSATEQAQCCSPAKGGHQQRRRALH